MEKRVQDRDIILLPPLRSQTSAAEAVFFLVGRRGPEGPLYPVKPKTPNLKLL